MWGWNRQRPFSSQVCTTTADATLLLLGRVSIGRADESTECRRVRVRVENLDVELLWLSGGRVSVGLADESTE